MANLKVFIAVLVIQMLIFPDRIWCQSNDVSAFVKNPSTETLGPLRSAGRKKYTAFLVESVRGMSADAQGKFLMPDQLQSMLTEIKTQYSYLLEDSKKDGKATEVTTVLERTASPDLSEITQKLKDSPYDLENTFHLSQLLTLMERSASDWGDSFLKNRFSVIGEKLQKHIVFLCQLDDMNLDMSAVTCFKDSERTPQSQK